MKTSSIFKSRWKALLWAGGILWFAYDFAGTPDASANGTDNAAAATDATGAPISTDDANNIARIVNGL